MKTIFRDKQLANKYRQSGIVVVPFASMEQIKNLYKTFLKHYPDAEKNSRTFFYSLLQSSGSKSMEIKIEIAAILEESYEKIFEQYKSILQCFLAKPKDDVDFHLHQDWSYTDEVANECATVWCPLEDVTIDRGCLFAIKGSQRFFNNFRSGNLETSRIMKNSFLEPYIEAIEIKKGEAAIFHPAIFHGSFPDKSNKLRVIVASIILPKNEEISYFHSNGQGIVNQHLISEDYYFNNIEPMSLGTMAPNVTIAKSIQYNHVLLTEYDLAEKLNENYVV